jgi:Arc/MetJ-type ribon-helix-helix transcriptional regulator
MLIGMHTRQVAVRLPEDLLATVDRLVTAGVYPSRAAAVRAGLEAVADAERRRAVDVAVVDGYRRIPPTASEDAAATSSLRDAIAEEAW